MITKQGLERRACSAGKLVGCQDVSSRMLMCQYARLRSPRLPCALPRASTTCARHSTSILGLDSARRAMAWGYGGTRQPQGSSTMQYEQYEVSGVRVEA